MKFGGGVLVGDAGVDLQEHVGIAAAGLLLQVHADSRMLARTAAR